MASVVASDLPAYVIGELGSTSRHVVLSPALRWRMIVEESTTQADDLMLQAVVRLLEAGERAPARVADLLQLPIELIQHLQARAIRERFSAVPDGGLVTSVSSVRWVYRDLVTDEFYPETSAEIPAVPLRFLAGNKEARLRTGSAGAPVTVSCLLMDAEDHEAGPPTALELSRYSRRGSTISHRVAVVSEGILCLLISVASRTPDGVSVTTPGGLPHGGLTRALQRQSTRDRLTSDWLDRLPTLAQGDQTVAGTPLLWAHQAALSAHAEWMDVRGSVATNRLISCLDLLVRRCCDELSYLHHTDLRGSTGPTASQLTNQVRLDALDAELLLTAAPDSLAAPLKALVSASRSWDAASQSHVHAVVHVGISVLRVSEPTLTRSLGPLAERCFALSTRLTDLEVDLGS